MCAVRLTKSFHHAAPVYNYDVKNVVPDYRHVQHDSCVIMGSSKTEERPREYAEKKKEGVRWCLTEPGRPRAGGRPSSFVIPFERPLSCTLVSLSAAYAASASSNRPDEDGRPVSSSSATRRQCLVMVSSSHERTS